MAHKVRWTPDALGDLAEIGEHIAQDDPDAAFKVGSQLLDHVRLLEGFPNIGPAYRWRHDGRVREILCLSYRIFYRVDDERKQVEILNIWHTSRAEPDFGK